MAKKKLNTMGFLDDFYKDLSGMEGVGTSSKPPRYWYSIGNYAMNRILSGSFVKCIPQGRITNFAGPSGSGKSYLAMNAAAQAQKDGAHILVVDTENALDDDFVSKIGVNPHENYTYADVTTIQQAVHVISAFLKGYKEEYGSAEDAPQILIVLDSLDMMMTETELEHYDKGVQKGDQGQKNKQLKHMLRTIVQDIKTLNVAMICTSQVYRNQDVTNGEGVFIVADAVRYSASQIAMLKKLKLKDDTKKKPGQSGEVTGVTIIVEGYKTRFTKPYQTVRIEVPYDHGMDPYSGLIEAARSLGVVVQSGSWYNLSGETEKWYKKDMDQTIVDRMIPLLEAKAGYVNFELEEGSELDLDTESKKDLAKRRQTIHVGDVTE